MLAPELKKLKEYLEGTRIEGTRNQIDKELLLQELREIDDDNMKSIHESLAPSDRTCPACGRKL